MWVWRHTDGLEDPNLVKGHFCVILKIFHSKESPSIFRSHLVFRCNAFPCGKSLKHWTIFYFFSKLHEELPTKGNKNYFSTKIHHGVKFQYSTNVTTSIDGDVVGCRWRKFHLDSTMEEECVIWLVELGPHWPIFHIPWYLVNRSFDRRRL